MTDTEINEDMFNTDDVNEDEDDLEFDLDNLYPAEGDYEVTILSVAFRNGISRNSGKNAIGFNIRLQMTGDGPFSGQFLTHYLYLGEDTPKPGNLQNWASFLQACGMESTGKLKVSDYAPAWKTIGKQREKVLTVFDNLVIGAHLRPPSKEDIADPEARKDVKVIYWLSQDQLDASANADVDTDNPGF